MTDPKAQPPPAPPREGEPPDQQPSRPWRTEGLPKGQPARRRPAWPGWAPWLVGYRLLFGLLTLQDRFAGPQAVPYTEFKVQVANLSALPAEGDPRIMGTSSALLDLVDEEVHRVSDECLAEARRLLKENRDKLDEPAVYAAAGIPRLASAGGAGAAAAAAAQAPKA